MSTIGGGMVASSTRWRIAATVGWCARDRPGAGCMGRRSQPRVNRGWEKGKNRAKNRPAVGSWGVVSLDFRSRTEAEVGDVDPAHFFTEVLPDLATRHLDLAAPGARELGV